MRWLGGEWKRGAIYGSIVLMETCWLTAWVALLHPSILSGQTLSIAALVFTVLLFGTLVVRLLDYLGFELAAQQRIMVILGLVVALSFVRIRYYSVFGFGDVRWIGALITAIGQVFSRVPEEISSLGVMLVLWWRALSIGSREITHHGVAFSFRVGVVLLMFNGLAAAFMGGPQSLTYLGFAYFLFSLMAIGLSRIDELEQQPEGAVSPFGGYWLSTTVGGALAVLALAAGASALFSPGNVGTAVRFLNPVFRVIEWALAGLLFILAAVLGPPLEALFRFLLRAMRPVLEKVLDRPLLAVPEPFKVEPQGPPPAYLGIIKIALIAVVVLIVIGLLMLSVDRYKKRARMAGRASDHRMDWEPVSPAEAVKRAIRAGVDRLADLWNMARQFGAGRRLRAAISIRWIYANLSRLAAEAGFARAPTQTPWEYLPDLFQAFPGDNADVEVVTQAYVKTHYGEVPTSDQELDGIRQAWERIRAHERTRGRVIPAEETTA